MMLTIPAFSMKSAAKSKSLVQACMSENFGWKLNMFSNYEFEAAVCRWWRPKNIWNNNISNMIWLLVLSSPSRYFSIVISCLTVTHSTLTQLGIQVAGSPSSIYPNPIAVCKLAYTFLYNRVFLLLLFPFLSEFVKWLPNAIWVSRDMQQQQQQQHAVWNQTLPIKANDTFRMRNDVNISDE